MNGLPLDHVAVAVPSIEGARETYEHLTGMTCSEPEHVPSQGVMVAFVGNVELIEPIDPDGPVARFIRKRADRHGLHHIGYRTDDIRSEVERLVAEGFRPIDPEPRPGTSGHQVVFLHPKSTGGVLIELVQVG